MKFSEAIAEQARRFTKSLDDTEFVSLAKPLINLAYLDVGKSWEWPQLLTSGSILAIPVITGTATIATDSRTVVVAGAVASYEGRFFKIIGGSNDYRIIYVDVATSTLTLDQPIIEASATVSFEIEKRFYTLPTEVRRIVGWDKNERMVVSLDNQGLRQNLPDRNMPFSDVPFEIAGVDDFTDKYSVGTVSTTSENTNTLIGDGGQEWLSNALPGNILTISGQDYRIKNIETNTRINLYNKIGGILSAAPYSISIDSALTLRPYYDFSIKKVIRYKYIRSVFDLVHQDDIILLPNEAKLAVLDFSQAYIKEALGVTGWETVLIKAQARLESAQANSRPVHPAYKQFVPLIPSGLGRGR